MDKESEDLHDQRRSSARTRSFATGDFLDIALDIVVQVLSTISPPHISYQKLLRSWQPPLNFRVAFTDLYHGRGTDLEEADRFRQQEDLPVRFKHLFT